MKKALKISAIVLGAALILLLLIPFIFKGKIVQQVQKEINANLNAKVSFEDVGLSLLSHFPDMTLKLKKLQVVGVNEFREDTLADIPALSLTINLMSVIRGSNYEVKQIYLDTPRILLKVLKDGKVNWDIAKSSGKADTVKTASSFKVMLNKIEINGGNLIYDDRETPMYFALSGFTAKLGGDMTADKTNLDIDADAAAVQAGYEGVTYLRQCHTMLKTKLEADLAKWIFTFKDAKLSMNDLKLKADGFFAMPQDGYDMDIKFAAEENTFKSFLSLIPAIYAKDFSSVKAEGTLAFDGFVKGKYTDLSMPSFGINLKIANGMFSYPSLPGNVSDVNITASINNPDGNTDHTVIDIPKMHLKMMKNPLDASFTLKTPVSDPEIKGWLKGMLDFSDVSRIYPLGDKTTLTGLMNADISLEGKLSSIETGRYDQFMADGFATMENINYSSPDLPQLVKVSKARLDFSPAYIALTGLAMQIGKNDLAANGKIENYLPYFLKSTGILKGSLTTTSSYMDINSLVTGGSSSASDSSALTVIEVPGNIDFTLKSTFNKLIYDTYNIQNAAGTVIIRDKSLIFQGLNMQMLGGSIAMDGSYSTFDISKPRVDLSLKIKEVDVKEAFKTFNTIKTFAPVAENLNGKLSTNLKFKGNLKKDMMPEMSSLSGDGLLMSNVLSVDNINTFNIIADLLKIEKLRKPAIEKLNLSFDLVDGKATVKPVDFKLAGYKSNFAGTIALDKALNFALNLEIPRSDFGGKANGVLNGLATVASRKGLNVNLGDMVPVTLLIGGTITDPKVTAGVKQAMAGVVEDLKQQAVAQVQQKKEEVIAKAKVEANKLIDQADAQAAKILDIARQQSDQVIKSAQIAADKIRKQSDSAANRVMAEGKKNGMLAEMASKKAADKIKKEGDLKARQVVQEGQSKADAILNKAKSEADQLKEQARNRAK
ncbi:MAG: hypothetical protein HXX13_12055 [Bacteroidetes bacterium]|nr:hypothetical protein [Bacteroidota bacterium]